MKLLIPGIITVCVAIAADIKSLPNQAGNGDIDIAGNVFVVANEIQEILGAPLPMGYVVVRVKVSTRTAQAIRISPDDFTLVSRKDGERSPALLPTHIAGPVHLVVKGGKSTPSEITRGPENPLLKILESKILPDIETKELVEGLLYFLLEGKNKPKDLGLLYKGPAGRLAMDFK